MFVLGFFAGRFSHAIRRPEKATPAPTPVARTDDELERIEGIGSAMATALRAAGIRTFAQLAAADDATKRAAIKAAGLSFAPSLTTWSRQARLLADGDETAFRVLTATLIAGRPEQQPPSPALPADRHVTPNQHAPASPAPTTPGAAPTPRESGTTTARTTHEPGATTARTTRESGAAVVADGRKDGDRAARRDGTGPVDAGVAGVAQQGAARDVEVAR
ncbi:MULTISPECIES: helix-hairpin-helix domain-containing protein [Catenuloplanes]|uniref:Helix-hairpin-helix domain-containing protein n=1 Tax=Catenuloplanes niger TaxID=587534 RepID=A0AAE3ZLB4_9ACTN|nr:helix-hairpin-helix domain-containing protein [Catenuloplanes niger]MDR7321017.1 hypothetical protein [Catenuloplanes niger]